MESNAILLIHCHDRKGLINTIANFLYEHNGNIIELDEHVDTTENDFFMRVEWELKGFNIPKTEISQAFEDSVARHHPMHWQLHFSGRIPRMAVFVSTASHCLYDILSRHYSGEWQVEIPLIISNHEVHRKVADRFSIPFHYFKIDKENKSAIEKQQLELLKSHEIDFIILARYMQILTANFINHYPNRIINIHHSFLPAFAGAKPYHRAYERGVKIIGATSHYVTTDLDAGPILEQDVTRISHKDSIRDLIRKGKDLEKIVLSRAIWIHLKRKALVHQNKTVIFD